MKNCLASSANKALEIKTILRFHFTPVRMASIKDSKSTNAGEGVKGKEHLHNVSGNINQYNYCGSHNGDFLKNKNRKSTCSSYVSSEYISKIKVIIL